MIQGLLAIILLILAAGLFLWGRRSASPQRGGEDPDVILGLAESSASPPVQAPTPTPAAVAPALKPPVQRVILFLRASAGRPYGGYELLQSLLSCGLRFGEQNIFHRYEQRTDQAVVLFSVAAATHNGEINPAHMGEFTCRGLSLFLTLNQHLYPSVNFELMLDTARQLLEDLGGTLLDDQQTPLTQDKIQQLRERINQFETSQQTMELFV